MDQVLTDKFAVSTRCIRSVALALVALMVVSGCARMSRSLGISKNAPDEFSVVTKAPLVIPPEYNLRPPDTSQSRAEDVDSQVAAFRALFPEGSTLPSPSRGELALLERSGADSVDPDIRHNLGQRDRPAALKGAFTRELLYGVPGGSEGAPTIERMAPTPLGQ